MNDGVRHGSVIVFVLFCRVKYNIRMQWELRGVKLRRRVSKTEGVGVATVHCCCCCFYFGGGMGRKICCEGSRNVGGRTVERAVCG